MGVEIERKFLVRNRDWFARIYSSARIRQGYLANETDISVRVRTVGSEAWLTIKGPARGMSRPEFEYAIPRADAEQMLAHLCRKPLIEKTRYWLNHGDHTWEIDVFEGDNTGLVVAEVELGAVEEDVDLPPWVGDEVTDDSRYLNASLVKRPYRQW